MPRKPPADPTTADPSAGPPAAPSPFTRRWMVGRLRPSAPPAIDEAASPEERAAVAEALQLRALDALAIEGRLAPEGRAGWRFDGRVRAAYAQTCVVSLEPAPGRLDEPVERIWLPPSEVSAAEAAAEIDPELGEEPEPLPEAIDLGAVAVETLALALDPYPRAPGAALEIDAAAPPGAAPIEPAEERPFAALAKLKAQMTPETDDHAPEPDPEDRPKRESDA